MMEKILEIQNLHVDYEVDKVMSHAVNGIDISLNKGEILGLVGETGAGKTTTALGILGLLPKYITHISGSIKYKGQEIIGAKAEVLQSIRGNEISMIFQDPMTSLNPVFTIGKQIGDVIKIHNKKMPKEEVNQKVCEILEMVGIPAERAKEYPHQFSGGMKQRVVIAIAIACNPDLLIADEPTTALDVTIQAQVLRMIRNLQSTLGSSVILITHDLGIVANFCDNVAVMYAGEIVEYGSVYDIFDKSKPHHMYTKGLFDSIPDLTKRSSMLKPIKGLAPHPSELPEGCKFHPRCDACMEICKKGPVPVHEGHRIACHLCSYAEVE